MRITKKCLLTLLISATPAFGQDIRQDVEPDPNPRGQNEQNGNLNNNQQDVIESSYNKTYNGAGSSGMPASSAISPSLMSSGSESCLQSVSGGLQLIGVGVSSGRYMQDTECNRRRDSITLSNMGMKVAAVSLMCQNPNVWQAMLMSATPCPVIKSGSLVVGKRALLLIKQRPELYIPDYAERQTFYDEILGVGEEATNEEESTISLSDRFRASKRAGN